MGEAALEDAEPDRRVPPRRLPYTRHSLSNDDLAAVRGALLSERIAQGPLAGRFERALAASVHTANAVAVSSGTSALKLALAALGVGPGDEVIVPPLTFVATANAVSLCGATPRFADVDPETLTLDPEAVRRSVGPRTRGVVAMHYGGHPADVDAIARAAGPGRFIVEDACHALGASWRGRPCGSLGDAACFSFHPAKTITTGEGGAITTSSPELAECARALREHGIERRPSRFEGLGMPARLAAEEKGPWVYELPRLAGNHRLSEPAAALGLSQLARIAEFVDRRRLLARAYQRALGDMPELILPSERPEASSAWHLYPVRLRVEALRGGRAALFAALHARDLGVQVHYVPVHLQPHYRRACGTRWGDFPVSEDAYLRLVSLPLFPDLRESDVDRVATILREELRRAAR